jgi:hypothetical protein
LAGVEDPVDDDPDPEVLGVEDPLLDDSLLEDPLVEEPELPAPSAEPPPDPEEVVFDEEPDELEARESVR